MRINILKGMEQGIYRGNLDVDFVTRIYFSGMTSLKDESIFPRQQFPILPLMDDYLEYHLRGITTSEGRNILKTVINSNQD